MPNWLAITIGRWIIAWRPLELHELAHELTHVRQWRDYGILFIPRYFRASWRAARGGGHRYSDNVFERAAMAAASRTARAEAGVRGTVVPPHGSNGQDALSPASDEA